MFQLCLDFLGVGCCQHAPSTWHLPIKENFRQSWSWPADAGGWFLWFLSAMPAWAGFGSSGFGRHILSVSYHSSFSSAVLSVVCPATSVSYKRIPLCSSSPPPACRVCVCVYHSRGGTTTILLDNRCWLLPYWFRLGLATGGVFILDCDIPHHSYSHCQYLSCELVDGP